MMNEEYIKAGHEGHSVKLSPPSNSLSDNYTKIPESAWNQTYPPHPGQSAYATNVPATCPPPTDYHQMQQAYPNNSLAAKYWS